MPIGELAEVRDLTGITDTNDLPDTRINTALGYGRGELYAITLKSDWDTDTTNPLYQKAKMIVELYAAYWILVRYAGYKDKATFLGEQIAVATGEFKTEFQQWELLTDAATGGAKFSIVASEYKTFPLNPDGEITKSKVIIPGD